MNSEVDLTKQCYQIRQKVTTAAKKCYQKWQKVIKVAKNCQSGEIGFRGVQRKHYVFKLHGPLCLRLAQRRRDVGAGPFGPAPKASSGI